MLTVVAIIGLTGLIALPKLNAAFDRSSVGSAKSRLTALYGSARTVATSANQTAGLRLIGNTVFVYASPRHKAGVGTIDTIVQPANLSTAYGVTLSGGVDSVRVASTGLGLDSAFIVVTKGYSADTLIINRFGRVLK
jgi:Tfp pilus assembly protein FimT